MRAEERSADEPSLQQVAEALRRGERPSERHFDRFLPEELREVTVYWTPLAVALKVAEWLRELDVKTMVDVGAGAGKLCVAVALASECEVTGIEQRPRLVHAACELADSFGVGGRVRFVQGVLGRDPLPPAQAYYLYNPFGENLLAPADRLDHDVELNERRYRNEVSWLERQLALAPPSTCLAVYSGFGGRMPSGYRELRADSKQQYPLRLWRKHPA